MPFATPTDRSQLLAEGMSATQVDRALRRGRLASTHHGVLVPSECAGEFVLRCRSALGTQRHDATLFGRSAAVGLELPLTPTAWGLPGEPIHTAAARDDLTRSRRRGLERHLRLLSPDEVTVWCGMRITVVTRTLCDLACSEPRLLALQLMDAALSDGRCSKDELAEAVHAFAGLRHVRRLRDLVQRSRAGIDSPRETTVRLGIVDAGLPEPDVRLELRDDSLLLARGDLGYWRWLIWIEYDGYEFHSERARFRGDRHRDRWLVRRGWEVMRLSDRDVAHPEQFYQQLRAAISEAPARIAAMPARRSPEVAAARVMLGIDPQPSRS